MCEQHQIGQKEESMIQEQEFYCPVFEGKITQYDCDEISTGIFRGRFVDDGLPYLMDLEVALSRRHRCKMCPRISDYYVLPGGSPLYALKHLGYQQEDTEEQHAAMLETIDQSTTGKTLKLNGRLACCQLPSGLQLWHEWDPQMGGVVDFQAHFATSNAMYMNIKSIRKSNNYGQLVRSQVFAGLRPSKKQERELVLSAFAAPNTNLYREDYLKEELIVQVCAFPVELDYFDNIVEYKTRRENQLAEESFVSGSAFEEFGKENMPDRSMMTGLIQKVSQVINEATEMLFYHVEVRCLDMVFDVVIHPRMLPEAPKAGAVLQGIYRFSARIIDFWYTGYNFEVDIEAPLTMARYETIRSALRNMQPGERIVCNLTSPIYEIEMLRAKHEVEGVSVEFKAQSEAGQSRILRFYPVTKDIADKIFLRTLVYENPPSFENAKDVTAEYETEQASLDLANQEKPDA